MNSAAMARSLLCGTGSERLCYLEAEARQKEKEMNDQRARDASQKRDTYKVAVVSSVVSSVFAAGLFHQ